NSFGNTIAFSPTVQTNPNTTNPAFGSCYLWVPDASPLKGAGSNARSDIGATVLYQYVNGNLTAAKLWATDGSPLFKGATVSGLNDVAGSLFDIANRLNINKNGCPFPASYVSGANL